MEAKQSESFQDAYSLSTNSGKNQKEKVHSSLKKTSADKTTGGQQKQLRKMQAQKRRRRKKKSQTIQEKSKLAVELFSGGKYQNLEPIPIDLTVDPPFRACFYCWGFGHETLNCPKPTQNIFCFNCGRRGVHVSSCPRCQKAHHTFLQQTLHQVDQVGNQDQHCESSPGNQISGLSDWHDQKNEFDPGNQDRALNEEDDPGAFYTIAQLTALSPTREELRIAIVEHWLSTITIPLDRDINNNEEVPD